jgi:hypothetical protein
MGANSVSCYCPLNKASTVFTVLIGIRTVNQKSIAKNTTVLLDIGPNQPLEPPYSCGWFYLIFFFNFWLFRRLQLSFSRNQQKKGDLDTGQQTGMFLFVAR